jgi:hypothetical protein
MTRINRCLSIVLGFLLLASAAVGQTAPAEKTEKSDETAIPIPPETSSVTKHDWTAGGQTIHYTATAGTLLVRDEEDKPYGSIFYVAYTLDGADADPRPSAFSTTAGQVPRPCGCTWARSRPSASRRQPQPDLRAAVQAGG